MAGHQDDERERESRLILKGIAGETEPGGASFAARTARNARNHLKGADIDPADRLEYWGTRVGRVFGIVLAVAMMVWLAVFLFRGR